MIGKDHELWEKYQRLGERWVSGQTEIESFQGYDLNPKQKEFVNSKKKFCLASGGFGSGKTIALAIKLALFAMFFPDNRILVGRKTRKLVETALLEDLFDVFPDGIYEYNKGPGNIEFGNGSKILLWGLEASQASHGSNMKKAEQDIKSLNLGAVFIDQLEEIEKEVFDALRGRLRRKSGINQINMTTNPANYWAYSFFKQENRDDSQLIEMSMLDNKEHLPDGYIEDHMNKPQRYVDRYVHGKWDQSNLVDDCVFAEEHIETARAFSKDPEKTQRDINIYESPQNSVYQIGVDPSKGAQDPCYISCVDTLSGHQVASYRGHIPLHAVAEKVMDMADMYMRMKKPEIIVETQGGGNTIIEKLKENNYKLYQREVFGRRKKKKTTKLGWHTNNKTKPQLVENFKELLENDRIKIRDEQIVNEMQTFVYQETGYAEASPNSHDDAIMGGMLSFWNIDPKSKGEQSRIKSSIFSQMRQPSKGVSRNYE